MSGFDKVINSSISEYEIYEAHSTDELEKVASANVDLPEGFVFDPDYLYMWVRIISAGEFYGPNKNGDYFPEAQLLKYYETFKEAHVFKNHENKKVENAIGEIISVRWNPIMRCVEIFKGIDRKAAPEIVRGFLKGYLTDVSMGCKVPYTVCSICGNKAKKQSEFCVHVRRHRMDFLGNGERVFEINYEPKFHDSSTVLVGAERVAKALMIIEPPSDGAQSTFKKVASVNGVTRYVKLADTEMQKVASHNETLHPMIQSYPMEKLASSNGFMKKIAELEKEITGKLMDIVSAPEEQKQESAEQMLSIIKFLTEKRMDSNSIKAIGTTLKSLAESECIPVHQSFSTLIGVAELMGIEFFPTELHELLSGLTDAKLVDELQTSESGSEDVFPSDFAQGINKMLAATEQLPEFDDTSNIFNMYDEGAHNVEMIKHNPIGFLDGIMGTNDLDQVPSTKVVKIIRGTLEPLMTTRSHHGEHLLPRLSVVLSGHQPIIGNGDVRKDLNILSNPQSLGDVLAALSYGNYQKLRPQIKVTRLVKMATEVDCELEKVAASPDDYFDKMKEQAAFNSGKKQGKKDTIKKIKTQKDALKKSGIKKRHMLLAAVPAAYGVSLFEKSRRNNGRYLSDAENFIADNPLAIGVGTALGGHVASKKVSQGAKGIKQGVQNLGKKMRKKASPSEFEVIVKEASNQSETAFNAFDENLMNHFSRISGLNGEETGALKIATLLCADGFKKEASEILAFYDIPEHAKGMFLKEAAEYTDAEMEKAAEDFMNTLLLDSLVDQRSMSATLPARMVDAFVFKKLGQMGDKDKKKVPDGPDFKEPMPPKTIPQSNIVKGDNIQ